MSRAFWIVLLLLPLVAVPSSAAPTPIADGNHPNLFWNQTEIDTLRSNITAGSPPLLANTYNTYIKDVVANTATIPDHQPAWRATLSYMIEPTTTKANAIKSYLFAVRSTYSGG